jgi:hypothetical protein
MKSAPSETPHVRLNLARSIVKTLSYRILVLVRSMVTAVPTIKAA